MTAVEKTYRLRVADAGASEVSGNVAFTETVNIASVGEVGGQRVYPLRSGTSARPWNVEVTDASEAITARLSDADGRAHLLRRLADLSVSTDGGDNWTVLATGRIADIEMVGVAAYRFTMQDERLVERSTTIFRAGNTTRLFPRGLEDAWVVYQGGDYAVYQVVDVDAANNTTTYLQAGKRGNQGPSEAERALEFSDRALDLLEEDVVEDPGTDQGNFQTLRAAITTVGSTTHVDREVETFNDAPATDPLKKLRDEPVRRPRTFTIAGFQDTEGFTHRVYFHMQDRDPTEEIPLHIGGQEGIDPFQLVKDIYDGEYQDATNPATVRYDSDAFSAYDETSNPAGLIDNPRFPKMHFRITGAANMAEWLDENIYGPLGVVPFINAAGEVSPRIARLPASDQLPDPDNLFEFTEANSREPYPTWHNQGREQVTVAEFEFTYAFAPSFIAESPGRWFNGFPTQGRRSNDRTPTPSDAETGSDLLATRTHVISHEHDRADDARVVHEMAIRGIHRVRQRIEFADAVKSDLFERFGDGPVLTTVHGLSDAESVVQGDWVKLDMDSYPNLANQARGGTRILQVIDRADTPEGPVFELLDAGPGLQPLSAPSVAVSANSNDPHNAVDITVSGLSSGESYEVHVAENATEPDEASPLWQYRTLRGDGNETRTLRGVPAGETLWVRARATAVGRISSDWSTADDQATTGLTAPSGLTDSDVAGDTATVSWTNGETDFDVLVDLDGAFIARLPAGATEFVFYDLEASTSYTAGVRHVDDYGGESSRDTDGFTTTGTATTLDAPRTPRILVGVEQ